jgi:glucoamylase
MAPLSAIVSSLLFAVPVFSSVYPRANDLASFINSQAKRSLQGVLDNIGPNGALTQGATSGVIIASPSTVSIA